MEKQIPAKLYKFQTLSCSSHTIKNLGSSVIWFSKPAMLNDPFDCAIPFRITGTEKEYRELYNELVKRLTEPRLEKIREVESVYLTNGKPNDTFKKHINETQLIENRKKIDDEFSQMGVACFSQRLDSILMWSHYADGHKGLCLEFDTQYLPFQDREKLHHVIYSDAYPPLSPVAVFRSSYMLVDPLITKSKDWKYEKEWRLIMNNGDSPLSYDPKALTAIYFGCAMLNDQKQQVAHLPAKSATRLFEMKRSNVKFTLEAVPYSG